MVTIISTIILAAIYAAVQLNRTSVIEEQIKKETKAYEEMADMLHEIKTSITYHASYTSGINAKLHQLGGLIVAAHIIEGWDKHEWKRLCEAWKNETVIEKVSGL